MSGTDGLCPTLGLCSGSGYCPFLFLVCGHEGILVRLVTSLTTCALRAILFKRFPLAIKAA